jgi:predicted RNA binding protein YcfA (HicA-like mRNA interferase family)
VTKLPLVDGKRLEKLLINLGFVKTRQKGSHIIYWHPDGRLTTIPHHGNRIISRPLLREILKEINISIEEYLEYMNKK